MGETIEKLQICACQIDFDEFGGGFTTSEICQDVAGLICIYCGQCPAVKISPMDSFQSLDSMLEDQTVLEDGWKAARHAKDFFKHKLLSFAVYRINEPPVKEAFECNYR